MFVSEIMSDQFVTISPETSITKATRLLLDEAVSSLMVIDATGRMIGMITESAVLAVTLDVQRRNDPVSLHMQRQFVKLQPHQAIEDAIELSILHRIRRIPVVENEKLIGLVSRRDLLRTVVGSESATAAVPYAR